MLFKNIPFLRICLPFIAGILCAIQFKWSAPPLIILLIIFLIALSFNFLNKQTKFTKLFFLLFADLFLFFLAVNLVNVTSERQQETYYGNFIKPDSLNKIIAVIEDLPVEKDKFYKYELRVLAIKNDSGYKRATGKVIGYFRKNSEKRFPSYGQTVLINTEFVEVESPKNPYEFDYKSYLEYRQIYHTCFVESSDYYIINDVSQLSALWIFGLRAKDFILTSLKQSNLTAESFAICAALLTGYDHEIDQSVMEAFSHSGTLHVLSVSGLHTGLIYLILSFLFDLFDRNKRYKRSKLIFITISLWCFALITGFSAPVLRAVVMFNLLGFGRIFFRNDYRNQINILMVSAFILLCYNPFFIKDIGFLLSYFALGGILFFQPVFAKLWAPENKISGYLWENVTASFAATLSTLPFTLFYFKQFPLWFFVCNLIVVPASFLILSLAVLVVLKFNSFTIIINYCVKFLIWFISLFNTPGLGFIDNVDFRLIDAFILSFLIIILSIAFYSRSYKYTVYAFLLLIFWQLNGIIVSYQSKKENLFTVYSIRKEPSYSVKSGNQAIFYPLAKNNYNYHIKSHIASFNYPQIDSLHFNYVSSGSWNYLVLNKKNFWPATDYKAVTGIVISRNFKFKETDLGQFPMLKIIVADGTNNRYTIKYLADLCSKFAITLYCTEEEGAYIVNL